MYTLYTIPGSCSSGIVVLLEKLQLDYTAVQRADVANYTDFVPTNQVPALKTPEGQVITEGSAIALYLLEKHKSPMLPADIGEKAEFLRWLMFDYATLHPAYGRMFAIQYKVQLENDVKQQILQEMAKYVNSLWAILDKELATKTFITGAEPTLADYLAAVYSSWGKSFPEIDIRLGKNVERMIDTVANLPEFKAGYAKEGIEFSRPA